MDNNGNAREKIAYGLIIFSFIAIVIVSIVVLWLGDDDAPTLVFNTLIPLIATWVGTVIAFYFGSENFEAANKAIKDVVDKLTPEVLGSIPVKQIMIDIDTIIYREADPKNLSQIQLKDIKDLLDTTYKTRIPILAKDSKIPLYIIHKSSLVEFMQSNPTSNTLDLLINSNKSMFENFALVAENAKLSVAQEEMNKKHGCQDVFITATGKKDEALVGWLTNSLILRFINKPSNPA